MLIHLFIGDAVLNYLESKWSHQVFYCKITIFPLSLKNILGGVLWDYVNILYFCKRSPTASSIHHATTITVFY